MKNIKLLLTGGTICSSRDSEGRKDTSERNVRILVDNFRKLGINISSESETVFDECWPVNTLSENMTLSKLSKIVNAVKDALDGEHDGIIILHGTDTLGYTSALLGLLFANVNIPVFLVSSNRILEAEGANGNDNFLAAVKLIHAGIRPGVYVPYENMDPVTGRPGKMYIHRAVSITQCPDYSEDFFSSDMLEYSGAEDFVKKEWDNSEKEDIDIPEKLERGVLKIEPYSGLDYSAYSLENVKAVIHGTYHSMTACADVSEEEEDFSILSMIKRCSNRNIPFFISPSMGRTEDDYASARMISDSGAIPLYGMTSEMAYMKLVCGISLGLKGDELVSFMKKEFSNEFTY